MKRTLSILVITIIGIVCTSYAQTMEIALEKDQNPNYKIAMEKCLTTTAEYTIQQGITLQETYKAIDPLEEKRELRAQKRRNRAQRPYWRHQRRLQRIKNTQYYQNDRGYYSYAPFFGYNTGVFASDILTLGFLGACIIN